MSLVQHSIITLLNRRFVSTYWDAFKRGDKDMNAVKLGKGHKLQYGSIFTPGGKQVNAFGYSKKGFYNSLKKALKEHPELNWRTAEEKAILKKAAEHPEDNAANFAAARLHLELMEFTDVYRILDMVLSHDKNGQNSPGHIRVRYLKVYAEIQDFINTKTDKVKKELLALENLGDKVPVDIQDDISVLLVAVDTKLKARGGPNPNSGFFNGYEFKPNTDVSAHLNKLKELIANYPKSNRAGEMLFLRGLGEYYSGKTKEANDTWKKHYTEFPEDRTAMLSRVHHKSYAYGFQGPPGKKNTPRVTLGVSLDQKMAVSRVMESSIAKKFGIQVGDKLVSINGVKVMSDTFRAHMGLLQKAFEKAKIPKNMKTVMVERDGKELKLKQ